MNISNFIKTKRIELGLTMKNVADYVGVSEGTISRWESGEIKNMKRNKIAKLSQILKISPMKLMGEIETDNLIFTEHEKKVIQAYRAKPQMQSAVDTLLGIEETITIKYAARNGSTGEHKLTKEEVEKLSSLPDVKDI